MPDRDLTSYLLVPGPDDDLAARLSAQVDQIAARRLASYRGAALPPGLRAPLAAARRALAAGPGGLVAACADLDVRTCALALADEPTVDADAAATLIARADRGAAFADDLPITAALPTARLATVDRNPVRHLEAHPDKAGNALDWGDHAPAAWTAALTVALEAIAAALPTLHAELAITLRRIVPVGFDGERHLSCSFREAPGLIYLSLHPDPLTLAEAVIHETQHGKLNLVSWLAPLLDNPPDERVTSPARPDLRPVHGVLLAAHAFVPVAALHHRLAALAHPLARSPQFARRQAQVTAGNAAALATLRDHARPTTAGAPIVAAIAELHARLA